MVIDPISSPVRTVFAGRPSSLRLILMPYSTSLQQHLQISNGSAYETIRVTVDTAAYLEDLRSVKVEIWSQRGGTLKLS